MFILSCILFTCCVIMVITGIVFSIKEKDIRLIPQIILIAVLGVAWGFRISGELPRSGTITDIQIIEASSVTKVVEGKIENVTECQYVLLIQTEDGEYRVMKSETGEDWSGYKEGETITYTIRNTIKIEEEK